MTTLMLPDGLCPEDVVALERVARHLALRRAAATDDRLADWPLGSPYDLTAEGAIIDENGGRLALVTVDAPAIGRLLTEAPALLRALRLARPYVDCCVEADGTWTPASDALAILDLALSAATGVEG